jgi:hypothetical protein
MSEGEKKDKNAPHQRFDLSSRFWKTFLVMVAVILTFVGPTYAVLGFYNVLDVDYAISMGSGFGLLIVGLVLMWYLVKKKVIL